MKFGGTSMAGTERIRRVANIVRKQQAAGHEVAVVVSAMEGQVAEEVAAEVREAEAESAAEERAANAEILAELRALRAEVADLRVRD